MTKAVVGSAERSAPIGKLWALNRHIPIDLPVGTPEFAGLTVSRQLARKLGWPGAESYPDWPGYPNSQASGPHMCMVCDKRHLTADKPRHADWAESVTSRLQSVTTVTESVTSVTRRCPMCDKPLTGRQRLCSPACRKRASRT